MTKIVAISDTHGKEYLIDLPLGDILIYAGDFNILDEMSLTHANLWFAEQDFRYKIYVAGNHDEYLQKIGKDEVKRIFTNVIYLEDEMVDIDGLRIYGSPWSPTFGHWAFMKPRRSVDLKATWSKIPENLDILATHCPPYGVLDRNMLDHRCGCEVLARELMLKRPKKHIFGHIHEYGGQSMTLANVDLFNVSILDGRYQLKNTPTIIEIKNEME